LKEAVGGRLINVESPFAACAGDPDTPACEELLRNLRNPFFVGEQPWGTQSSGWADAWVTSPSVYAVAAEGAGDVAAAVDFARQALKGGGGGSFGVVTRLTLKTHVLAERAGAASLPSRRCRARRFTN